MSVQKRLRLLPVLALPILLSSCGDCAGVGLFRLAETERSIRVGESFLATYEGGGSCGGIFRPALTQWFTADTAIVELDTLSGLVRGKRVGDARVVPAYGGVPNGLHPAREVSNGSSFLLVRVR